VSSPEITPSAVARPQPTGESARGGGSSLRSERGQTLAMMAVFMVVLLGASAMAIDLGNWWLQKRELQNAADAAALAGASSLPASWQAAQAASQANYSTNGRSTDTVTYQNTTDMSSNDSVTVTTSRTVPTWFAQIFGIGSARISATARATVESVTQAAGPAVMPWGVLQNSYTAGQTYSIYTTNVSNANNGAIDVPYVSGSNCPVPTGATTYSDLIGGSLTPCAVSVGESVNTKPGNNSGPTSQGITARITNWQTLDQIVRFNSDGTTTLIDSTSPQLVLVPVLTNPDGSGGWPNGTSSPMTVVGFAWFVITGCGPNDLPATCSNASGGKQVDGTFVSLDSSPTVGTGGKWVPSSNTAYMAALTK